MADGKVEYIGSERIDLLSDDILLHLYNNFLGEKECLNLSLSGVSKKFTILHNRYCDIIQTKPNKNACPFHVTGKVSTSVGSTLSPQLHGELSLPLSSFKWIHW
jgi:hypothetical protein